MSLSKEELKRVENQISSTTSLLKKNPSDLWNITLHRPEPTVGIEWMKGQGWSLCRNSKLTKRFRDEVNVLLREEGIILDGWKTEHLNMRRRILAWWNPLTKKEKISLKHYNGCNLSLSSYVSQFNTTEPKIRKIIDDINEELQKLGGFGCPKMADVIDKLVNYPSSLWNIPLKFIKDDLVHNQTTVCFMWLRDQGWEQDVNTQATKKLRQRINELLIEEGVIIDGVEVGQLNCRRRILEWWSHLTEEDKRKLVHFSKGKLAINYYVDKVTLTSPITQKVIDDINHELDELGNFGCPKMAIVIDNLKKDPSALWQIPLSHGKDNSNQRKVVVCFDWLKKQGWVFKPVSIATKKLRSKLNELHLNEGVIIENGSAADLNLRRKLLAWWNPLTEEEKKGLDHIYSNKLVVSYYVKGARVKSNFTHYHEALDEIHDDLLELGVLKKDYLQLADRLGARALRKNKMQETIDCLKKTPSLLWEIPLINSSTDDVLPSSRWLKEQNLKTSGIVDYYREFLDTMTNLLRAEGVIIEGWKATQLDMRRRILAWWKPLVKEEKRKLKHSGNQLSIHNYVKGLRTGDSKCSLIEDVLNDINTELLELEVLNRDYVKVTDRAFTSQARKNLQTNIDKKNKTDSWHKLINKSLNSVDDILPVKSQNYAQVCHLIAATSKKSPSESGRSNYMSSCSQFISYLSASSIPHDTRLENILNPYILLKFKQDYVLPKVYSGELSPLWANTILSCIKISLDRAKQIKGLNFFTFIDPGLIPENESKRTTDMYRPYSPSIRNQITDAIEKDIIEIEMLLKPYKLTGIGADPFDESLQIIYGKGTIENARYIFENYLNCNPTYNFDDSPCAAGFVRIIGYSDKGLHELYKEWGIIPIISKELILPLLYRLAQVTGMNADSLLELDVDDYIESHHATGKPCLTYWKERSEGGKEYHLDIFDAEVQWLTTSQSKLVRSTIETILKLTERVRVKADKSISSKLFVCESATPRSYLNPMKITSLGDEYKKFAIRHDIKDEDGSVISVNIARFRPSFVSELIDKGVSLREIQLLLGHKSISTTMNYLDRLDFNRVARTKVKEALTKLKGECDSSNQAKPKTKRNYRANKDNIIFTTPLGGCANIFNPPDFIRNSSLYVEGRPCSQYNKCLSCDNVLITRDHLPELFSMQRDYLQLMKLNRVMETPYGLVIEENLSLLDDILSVKKSDFYEEELREAERRSQFVETTILDDVGA
jgi:integrase